MSIGVPKTEDELRAATTSVIGPTVCIMLSVTDAPNV